MSPEMPNVAACGGRSRCDVHRRFGDDPGLHEGIKAMMGFGRDFPGDIIDDEAILAWAQAREKLGSWEAVGLAYRKHAPRELLARLRAVLMNLSRMRRENGGMLPWEA